MIVYPNAKINIGLNIVERRNDGYHNISTLFYPVKELKDILEITIDDSLREPLTFTQTGIQLDCSPENNLCIKAYNLINSIQPLPTMRMHLHKLIPTGAGLGGGSADGAFALK
ncbi:MAG TPA: 4-(cytidine 5'-diphospho)-2-C-methyl-D-erythritol kinase, partial [Tenuifilaceae bacterium]|nr:4-(cytidine 5'-diphospho)-2-C-methyl-D-erythritol kinase [Tenuifilaceae bacterium]